MEKSGNISGNSQVNKRQECVRGGNVNSNLVKLKKDFNKI